MLLWKRLATLCAPMFIFLITATALADNFTKDCFPKGTLTIEGYATDAGGLDADANLASGAIGFGYFVLQNLSLGLEADGYHERVSGEDAWGYGISGVLRHHLVRYEQSTLFADVTFGPIESTSPLPVGGTNFNFIFRTGLGVTYQLDEHLHLMSGIRYFHVSNARLEGAQRNPSINGAEGYIGLMWIVSGRR
jgi:hypothetical protein